MSGLVYTTRIGLPVLEKIHEMIERLCNKLGICYVDNRNIRRKHLWKMVYISSNMLRSFQQTMFSLT